MPLVKKTKMHIKKLPKLLEEHLQYLNLNGMEWHEALHQEQQARRRKFPLFDYSLNYFHKQIFEFQADHSPFLEFKKSRKFTSLLKHGIIHSIGFCL